MDLDLELYRHEIRLSNQPLIRLSAIDLHPELPKKTIVLLHGYGGNAKQWVYQLQEFSLKNRVIALDLRGHGLSDAPPTQYTMQEMLADLLTALDKLGVTEKIILAGHSFGGAIASQFAHDYPEKVERLILTATTGEYKLNPVYALPLRLPVWVLHLIRPFVRKNLSSPPVVLKRFYHNNLAVWNGWEVFPNIKVPTMVIRGHRDRVFAQQHFAEVPQMIPNVEDVNVGASGHMVILERRDAVNRAIQRFIRRKTSSWRADEGQEDTSSRQGLIADRPWLNYYEDGVPFTISLPNVPVHQLLRSAVRRFPLRWALKFMGTRITYRRLSHEVNRFANALRSKGIDKGDRVLLLMPNIPQQVIAFFGVLKAGGVAVFTLPLNEPQELVRQAADSGARIMVTIHQFAAVAQQALQETNVEHIIFTAATDYLPNPKRLAAWLSPARRAENKLIFDQPQRASFFTKTLYQHSHRSPSVHISPEDLAVIIYTGGTTAAPKGVMLSHKNLVANTLQTRHWMPEAQEGKERFLCVLPFSHSYGLTTGMLVGVSVGATLILQPRFEIDKVLETIRREKPTIFPGVPHMYVAISNYPGVRRFKVSSIQACISGSAPLPVEVQESFEKLTRGRLVEGYGLTEASPVTHANPLRGRRKVGSIGIPLPSTEAQVVSFTDPAQEIPPGQIGELALRGPQVMRGYWENASATQKCILPDGWLLTGDAAQMDSDGYFRIIARKAEMWYPDKPGEPAFPRDVEEVLYEIPQVKEAAVVAIARQPIAFVIAGKQKPEVEDLLAYCKRRLPPELVPRLVIFVDEFPRSFIGKVLRRELSRYYEQTQTELS